jgi:hypothetical protein
MNTGKFTIRIDAEDAEKLKLVAEYVKASEGITYLSRSDIFRWAFKLAADVATNH